MALHIGYKNIADESFVYVTDDQGRKCLSDPVVTVGHYCMVIGIREITAENYTKWYARYTMFARAIDEPRENWFKLDTIRRCIGLTANVAEETDAAYAKWIRTKLEERAKTDLYNEGKEMMEAGIVTELPTLPKPKPRKR